MNMSMGEVLELMLGARHRVRTLRATADWWNDPDGWRRALERHAERGRARGGGFISVSTPDTGPVPRGPRPSAVRLWWERNRLREEYEPLDSDEPATVQVFDGELHWFYSPQTGFVTNEGETGGVRHARDLRIPPLDPAALIPAYGFTLLGPATQAGRAGIRLLARGREEEDRPRLTPLMPGADEYELVLDAERGLVLRMSARLDGREFRRKEVVEIAFDEELADETFRLEPPSDEHPPQSG